MCSAYFIRISANLKVDILKSNQAFDNIHKKSTNQADDVQSIKILLQALRSRPLIRQSRSARWHKTEDDKENEKEKEVSNENLEDEKKIKHSFKTRIHGDNNGKMTIRAQMWKTLTNLFSLRTISTLTKYSTTFNLDKHLVSMRLRFEINML